MISSILLSIWFLSLSSALGQVSYSIPEEMAKGSLVGNIVQDFGLDLKRLKSGKARIYTGDSAEYIELNKERGVLLIKERIDREALCGQTTPCALHFQIILENPMEFFSITVEIIDINDNTPSFEKSIIIFRISESAVLGSKFMLEPAIDLDVGINGLQSYMLKPTDNFNLIFKNQPGDGKNVEIVLKKPLDREKQHDIKLVLTAIDGGDPQLSGSIEIHITVLDVNDNAPVFLQSVYKATVTENAPKDTVVSTVSATDPDEGINSKIEYSIANRQDDARQLFGINQDTGQVTVVGVIDFEKARSYEISVQAGDHGGDPQLSGTAQIHITVLDVNDNAPVFTHKIYKASITENALKGTVVTTVRASDLDEGSNGKIAYAITNTLDNVPELFEINETNGEVRVTGNIDYEKARHYQIHVQAGDDGGLTDSCKIVLDVIDINDNKPQINIMSKLTTISENSNLGTVVTVINAQDPDAGENGKIDCSILGSIPFTLKSTNANFFSLVTDGDLDRERESEYNISVTCTDEGVPSLSSSVTLSLQISDVNDNAPVFDKSSYEASVQENNTPGLSIFTVRARDADFNQNARVSYILEDSSVNGVPVSSLVSVSADSGVIHALRSFDYEQIKDFTLTFYLVLALAVVSFLFIVSIIAILSVKCYRWRRERMFYKSGANLPVIPYYPPLYADVGGTGTLQHVYNYEVCRTTDSRKSDLKYIRPCSESIISLDSSGTQTLMHAQRGKLINEEFDDQVRIFISSLCSSLQHFFLLQKHSNRSYMHLKCFQFYIQ
uniref:Cadherin domain-containing protein n=1 Tax=Sinocyclocheilus grahami TaxID=75366 RepID=A0A672SCK8_SINGR